jgi:hypothetical protein
MYIISHGGIGVKRQCSRFRSLAACGLPASLAQHLPGNLTELGERGIMIV